MVTMVVILSRKTMTIEIGITGNHELSFDPSLRGLENELSATMGRCGHTGNCDCLGPDDHDNEGDDLDDDGKVDDDDDQCPQGGEGAIRCTQAILIVLALMITSRSRWR